MLCCFLPAQKASISHRNSFALAFRQWNSTTQLRLLPCLNQPHRSRFGFFSSKMRPTPAPPYALSIKDSPARTLSSLPLNLTLLVRRSLAAYHHYLSVSLDHFAFVAHRLHGRTYLHLSFSFAPFALFFCHTQPRAPFHRLFFTVGKIRIRITRIYNNTLFFSICQLIFVVYNIFFVQFKNIIVRFLTFFIPGSDLKT